MKKIALVFPILLIFAFIGCEKDLDFITNKNGVSNLSSELQEIYKMMPTRNYNHISTVGGEILHFSSFADYENAYQQLHSDCNMWDSLFYTTYGQTLSEDSLVIWEESIGYDEFYPVTLFEIALGVNGSMLYDQQRIVKQNWINRNFNSPDPTENLFIDEIEQAFYTIRKEICIADTIYQFRDNALILIPANKYSYWCEIRDFSLDSLSKEDVTIEIDNKEYICSENLSEHIHFRATTDITLTPENTAFLDSKEMIKIKIVGRRGLFHQAVVISKMENYKQINNKYKKVRRNCSITTDQTFFYERFHILNSNCIEYDTEPSINELPEIKNKKTYTTNVFTNFMFLDFHPLKFRRYGVLSDGLNLKYQYENNGEIEMEFDLN